MKPTIFNADYLLGPDLMDFDRPVEIHTARFGNNKFPLYRFPNTQGYKIPFKNSNAYKVLIVTSEPVCSPNKERINDIIDHASEYDLIMCTDEEILNSCDNSTLFLYGGTWLNKIELQHPDSLGVYEEGLEEKYKDKKYQISFMATGHRGMIGYEMRRDIWNNKHNLNKPTVFWSSARSPTNVNGFSDTLHDGHIPNGEKDNLFYSQFSIIVENCIQPNYFSEKLIDCLITKTIPIYFGCPNIGEYFDTGGLFTFNSIEELVDIVNNIDETTYEKLKSKIEDNFEKAKEYAQSFSKRVEQTIKQKINVSDILLTVGILTIEGREHFLTRLLNHLKQIIPADQAHKIEIFVNKDKKQKKVGEKRNEVLMAARGKYVCFIDDDDMVSHNYFTAILPELEKGVDCVGFYGNYYIQNQLVMQFSHANKNGGNFRKDGIQYRPINHLNPIKTSIAREILFPKINLSEDSDYSNELFKSGLIKTESNLDQILYHYFYDPKTTETQR